MRSLLLLALVSCAPADKQDWPAAGAAPSAVAAAAAPEQTPVTREPPPPAPAERCRWSTEQVRMDLVRADVRQVLQALADRAGINLVLADDVSGQVTVRLDGVPVDQALVVVAAAAGLELETDSCVTAVMRP